MLRDVVDTHRGGRAKTAYCLICGDVKAGHSRRQPGGHGHDLGLGFEREAPHADEVLRDLGQPLLVLVHQELGPVGQVLVYLLQRLGIAPLQPAPDGQLEGPPSQT